MPSVSEPWTGVYLQVAAAVLIFAVGFPALVMQAIISEDVRMVVHRQRRYYKWGAYGVLLYAATAVFLIWLTNPRSPATGQAADLLGGIALTLDVVLVIPFWYLQTQYRRDRILAFLTKKCLASIQACGTPNEQALLDIELLGAYSTSRSERMKVVESLHQLATQVQTHPRYNGSGLSDILHSLGVMLRASEDADELQRATFALTSLIENLRLSGYPYAPDMGSMLEVVRGVGMFSLGIEGGHASISSVLNQLVYGVNGVSDRTGQILFQLGKMALRNKRYLFAVEVLSKLEAVARQGLPAGPEQSADYLGLVAHFWEAGATARAKAKASLSSMAFEGTLAECLEVALGLHARRAELDTADKLRAMLKDFRKMKAQLATQVDRSI